MIDVETTTTGVTDMVIGFDVAGFPVAQPRFEVTVQVIISPLAGAY